MPLHKALFAGFKLKSPLTPRAPGVSRNGFFAQMQLFRIFLFGLLLARAPTVGWSAAASGSPAQLEAASGGEQAPEEHGLPQHAEEITRINTRLGPFPITNSMLVTWIVAVVLIVFAQLATRRMKEVPEGRRISGSGWWRVFTTFWKASSAITS